MSKVILNSENEYPQYPVFDENSEGVVFNSVKMPIRKLGLNFCLNRPTSLVYVKKPCFKKEDIPESYL